MPGCLHCGREVVHWCAYAAVRQVRQLCVYAVHGRELVPPGCPLSAELLWPLGHPVQSFVGGSVTPSLWAQLYNPLMRAMSQHLTRPFAVPSAHSLPVAAPWATFESQFIIRLMRRLL